MNIFNINKSLSKLIFGIENYDEILELVCKGNAENVDLTLNNVIGEAAKDENRLFVGTLHHDIDHFNW